MSCNCSSACALSAHALSVVCFWLPVRLLMWVQRGVGTAFVAEFETRLRSLVRLPRPSALLPCSCGVWKRLLCSCVKPACRGADKQVMGKERGNG